MAQSRTAPNDVSATKIVTGPSLGTDAAPTVEPRWLELLDRLNPETLTESFLTLIVEVDGYQAPPIPRSEIRRTAVLSFIAILDGLRSGQLDETVSISTDVGVSRARAGVSLSSLLTAVRLDFAVMWDALTSVAEADDAQVLVRHTRMMLRTVDEYVAQTQNAYLAEAQRIREESASLRRELLESLFSGLHTTTEQVSALARELQLSVTAPLLVAAAVGEDAVTLRVELAELERLGCTVHTHFLDGAVIAFLPATSQSRTHDAMCLARLESLRIGFTTVADGLAGLPTGARIARDLALVIEPGETDAMTWERGWARLAVRELAASGRPLIADVDAALAACSDAKRERLLESVLSYLRTGSIADSSAELFCHRNTLSKNLQQFREITGVDPMIPNQAARLVVGWA
ncbi:PucR family transcriptional regulator [Leucobacter sp. 1207-22]|uniref:PucR family transcriptional regulator n=1 Tax=Leucobacter sp. 1207-22 TaxID=2604456 RepID=UPI0040648B8D